MTWSAVRGVGDGVDDDARRRRRRAPEDALDRRRREVLAVDPDPVAGAAREPEEAVGVAVREVAGPVPAVARPLRVGLGVVVVPLERRRRVAADDLADRLAPR